MLYTAAIHADINAVHVIAYSVPCDCISPDYPELQLFAGAAAAIDMHGTLA